MSTTLTQAQRTALDAAATLARLGVPLFLARRDPAASTGFRLPSGWQHTEPDPTVPDRWEPGMALCAVMGVALDLLDVDPRNGGDLSALESVPRVYGVAATPSDGMHAFIAPLGAGSHDNVRPGVDVKGGFADGSSRGFAFLAPTERASKVTGETAAYRWVSGPEPWVDPDDVSGETLAARVAEVRGASGMRTPGGPDWWREFMASGEPQSQAAALRAIEAKLGEVTAWDAHAGTGFRTVLMRAALTLGGYVGGGWLDETDATERLEAACADAWGAPDDDDRQWITQGLADGAARPFHVYTPDDELRFGGDTAPAPVGNPHPGQRWTVYTGIGTEPYDPAGCAHDQEHAEAVLARCAPVLRYATDAGTWVRRSDADAWTETAGDQAGAAVSDVARLMPLGATPVPRDAADRTPEHWQAVRRASYLSSPGSGKIERKIRAVVAGGSHPSALRVADLDTEPELIWAGGVAWDLRASADEPTPAGLDPTTPHLHTAAVVPARVPTPAWDRFTATVWPDPEVRAWALRVLSVALTGYPDAALPVLYGPERTGKTSLIQLLVRLLGTYGHSADARLLGSGADNTHASVVYALKGRRLSFIDEGPRRGHLAIERLKQLTGGGALTGNAMRANPITFTPTHTLVMTTNDEPPITDPALRARIRLLPCEADQHEVRRARQAITDAVWADEAPGVLAALMAETARWLAAPDSAGNPAAPAVVRETVGEMATAQSPVAEWVSACTVPAEPGTAGRTLHRRFVTWMEGQPVYRRQSAPTETAFGRSLTELGFPAGKAEGHWVRPLSVMGMGPDGVVGPEPTGPGHMPVRRVGGGLMAGFDDQPARPENRSSTPVSNGVVAGLAGMSSTSNDNTHTTTTNGGPHDNTGPETSKCPPDPPGGGGPNVGSPATTGPVEFGGGTRQEPATGHDPVTRPQDPVDNSNSGSLSTERDESGGWAAAFDREQAERDAKRRATLGLTTEDEDAAEVARLAERNRATREAAALADQEKITKAEARARLKADKIAAAVAQASGETLALPAVVDRDGHTLAVTVDQARAVLDAALGRSGALTVDVETTGYPTGHADYALRSVQLGDHVAAVVLDPDETHQRRLAAEFLAAAPRLHAHSATADLVPLAMAGLCDHDEAWTRMHDTVLAAKLADPASTGSDPGLKRLAAAVLGDTATAPGADAAREAVFKAGKWLTNTKTDTPPERSGWAQIATGSTVMLRYAASDVLDTAALTRTLPAPPAAVLERERRFQAMTARVTHRGVALDAERVRRLHAEHTAAADELGGRIRAEYGIDNPGSTDQVGAALLDRGAGLPLTKTGKPSVTAAVLEKLRHAEGPVGELAATVLDYRHHRTLLGLFLGPYAELCDRGDGRARPTIYTLSADTGRTSATRPNIQQLPKTGGVRACITADPGQMIVSADFSSVELRVAAALSQDPTLLAFLAEGRDLHAEVARQVWGESAGKAERYVAKRIVFGRLYGGGIPTLAAQAGVSEGVASSAVDVLDALTPGLSAWSGSVRDAVKGGHTRFPTRSGRIVHLPREYPHKAPNYCIQGEARELLVDAYLRLADTRWADAVNFPVHDEIDLFVPEDEAGEATAALVSAMETELYGVAITAEASAPSFAWADST